MKSHIIPTSGLGSQTFVVNDDTYEKLSYSTQCKAAENCKFGMNCKYYHTEQDLNKFITAIRKNGKKTRVMEKQIGECIIPSDFCVTPFNDGTLVKISMEVRCRNGDKCAYNIGCAYQHTTEELDKCVPILKVDGTGNDTEKMNEFVHKIDSSTEIAKKYYHKYPRYIANGDGTFDEILEETVED